jgi:hypothetical protein
MAYAETFFKYLLILSLLVMGIISIYKDRFPESGFYDINALTDPLQSETERIPFKVRAGGQEYTITPKYEYDLQGVVVSYHDASSIFDMWHYKRWQDFLNERDLCVMWGENIRSHVYKDMKFSSDSWTCWFSWKDSSVSERFKMDGVSNNHLLIDDAKLMKQLKQAEIGDHVRIKGQLAEYANIANGFRRGTSTIRTDTGNGACETVYVTDFEVIKKANPRLRRSFAFAKSVMMISLVCFGLLFFIVPYQGRH